jgi:hypothetical protein
VLPSISRPRSGAPDEDDVALLNIVSPQDLVYRISRLAEFSAQRQLLPPSGGALFWPEKM